MTPFADTPPHKDCADNYTQPVRHIGCPFRNRAGTPARKFLLLGSLVEIGGLEPPASSLRTTRSPS